MRIHVSSAGLTAFLAIVARVKGDDNTDTEATADNQYIVFTYSDTNWTQSRTFYNKYVLEWTKQSSIQITNASLWKYDPTSKARSIIYNQAPHYTWAGGGAIEQSTQRRRNTGDVAFSGKIKETASKCRSQSLGSLDCNVHRSTNRRLIPQPILVNKIQHRGLLH
jgi:hypothetical protein